MSRAGYGVLAGLAAAFALLVLTPSGAFLPAGGDNGPAFYGMAEMIHRDAAGDVLGSQTVHNRLLDYGEETLIKSAFGGFSSARTPTEICITNIAPAVITETAEGSELGPPVGFSNGDTCKTANVDFTTNTTRVVLTATFNGTINIIGGQTITALAICDTVSDTDRTECSEVGDAFAAVVVPDTTVGANDEVDVIYTFDLSSPDD